MSAADPHFVYRCYDAADLLLYVGCTSNVKRRIGQHQHAGTRATLASRVLSICMARVEVASEHPSHAAGLAAEALDIQARKPLLNYQATWTPGWIVNLGIERYLIEHGIDLAAVDLSRCENCDRLRPYRATGSMCCDCRDPEFRAYMRTHLLEAAS